MTESIQRFDSRHLPVNAPQDFDIDAIEADLKSMWHEESAAADAGETAVVRARVANLVVYLAPGDSPQSVDGILDEITLSHPARALVIASEPQSAIPRIDAWVAARCQMPSAAGKQVCCEQVSIQAGGSFVRQVPSVIAQLLAPDLPVFLWCRGTPHLSDPLIKKLMDFADRVVIDSSKFDHPAGDLIALATLFRVSEDWTAVTDLNWADLTPRRTLLATFYDVADYRPYLDRVGRVTIEYAPPLIDPDAIAPRALLLAGWLASALKWTPVQRSARIEANRMLFDFSAGGRTVTFAFVSTPRPPELAGTITASSLEVTEAPSASFIVERSADGKRLQSRSILGGVERVGRVLAYDALSEADMLKHELQILGHDRLYEDVVRIAADLMAEIVQA